MDTTFRKNIFKPLVSAIIMGAIAYITYYYMNGVFGNSVATVIAILVGALSYGIAIVLTKTFSKEEIYMIPFGTKLYRILIKLKIYKEEEN